ncbi:MAG: hypothetical protein DRI24_20240 [Deltaproteobacteria bacterium]|nr:MAG: hypothetical protein DRI24_20240 [Deltaproteobacteria bacterium]
MFSSKYQPVKKRGLGKHKNFKRALSAKMTDSQKEGLTDEALDFLEATGNVSPTILDGLMAHYTAQALSHDPQTSQPAIREIFLRVFGKPVQVHTLEDDTIIEMEEVVPVSLKELDSEKIKQIEDNFKEAKKLNG